MFPINRIETGGFGITTGNLYNVKNINELSETKLKLDESFIQNFSNEKDRAQKKDEALDTYKKMVNIISPYINQVYTVTPNNQRALNGAELSDLFKKNNVNSEYQTDISKAVSSAVSFSNKSNTPLIILGTLYMYNDIKKSIISCIQ